ncbi:MAG TPA: hypothetical protein VG621_00025 [Candidatus Paceibacterota bacterium]|nr:hypothetical protein [Candidatus Paceibacterota bacterium]
MPTPPENTFFDINKLPPEKGLLLFGLSMNKLFLRQNPEHLIEDIRIFHTAKVSKPLVGLNFIYSDFLYLYSNEPAPKLKESFMTQMITHKNGVQKIIGKNNLDFQIQHAFNFMAWVQLYVGTKDFNELLNALKKIYAEDRRFQQYMKDDCELYDKEMGENQINFFLEEILMFYLLTKNQIKLPNDYIENNQKWILFCYPGAPLKSTTYMYQLNPFDIDWSENPYQNCVYDLESKKLIDFTRIDLETYNYKYEN